MTRKVDGTQRSGRFTAPSAAGGFGGADTALARLARPFTPKPFRSTGGMSASADTMMSLAMGRHNTDDEMPEDQVNIGSIVSRKTSDRRYLPRKLGNMKKYIHTTPINELLAQDDKIIQDQILAYEESINELFDNLSWSDVTDFFKRKSTEIGDSSKGIFKTIEPVLQVASGFVPFGDLFYVYRAYTELGEIKESAQELQDRLSEIGIDIDMFAPPEQNKAKIDVVPHLSDEQRAEIREVAIKIATLCYYFVTDAVAGIPLEVIPIPGLAAIDTAIDASIQAIAALGPKIDPTGEKIVNAFIEFSDKFGSKIRAIEDFLANAGDYIPGVDPEDLKGMHTVSNFIGNLAILSKYVASPTETAEQISEMRRRKKKKRTNEFSTTAGVAGYTGPMKGPTNPKQFYSTMARAAGSEYLVDPVKTSKPKP